jgi:5'(3')-deoxyribonucleotidase
MDDSIEDLTPPWVEHLNKKHGTSVKASDVSDWDISRFFPTLHPSEVFEPLSTDELWKNVKPKPGALKYLRRLKDDGHRLFIVTSCPCASIGPKMRHVFFGYLNGLFSWNDVIITSNKQMVRGDVLIDDGVHNHEGGAHFGILMDAAHNRSYDAEANSLVRVYTWEEVYSVICDFAKAGGDL